MSMIRLRNVSKIYDLGESRIEALQNVDLDIERGEFVSIWGPSGSGKTTLCNIIGTLDAPTTGNVLHDGQDVFGLTDDARTELRNRSIGFVFQSFNLLPVLDAVENVVLPLQIRSGDSRAVEEKAVRRLTELGLGSHLGHRPAKLSGGEQQRVAIARALMTDPEIVIADEPTANLDSDTARGIIDMMRRLNETEGTTFVFSTHDQRLLDRSRRQVRLLDGRVAADDRAAAT